VILNSHQREIARNKTLRELFLEACIKGENMKKKPTSEKTETNMISTRIPKGLMKRVKVFCDENEMTIQDFLADAITEKIELAHKERRKKSRL